MAASGEQAGFASEDECATWSLSDVGSGMSPIHGGIGYAQTASEAFSTLWAGGDKMMASGFNGLVVSNDGGQAWDFAKLASSDYVRGARATPTRATLTRATRCGRR